MPRKPDLRKKERYNDPFPERLREVVEETKTTQQEIADYLGVTRQMITNYQDGTTTPGIEILCQLAKFFSVSSDWLLKLSNYRSNERTQITLEELGLSEQATAFLDHLSTAKRHSQNSEGAKIKAASFEILDKLLSSELFGAFLISAYTYVQADPQKWTGRKIMRDTDSGEEYEVPAEFTRDLFWTHCVSPLKACLDQMQINTVASAAEE